MKTLTLLFLFVASIAGAQTIVTTNLINLTYINGTNTGNVYYETNATIPRQRIVLQNLGITNGGAYGVTNVVARLQAQIGGGWTTLETFYPSTTNAIVDSLVSTSAKASIPMRVEVVTTNAIGISTLRQLVVP